MVKKFDVCIFEVIGIDTMMMFCLNQYFLVIILLEYGITSGCKMLIINPPLLASLFSLHPQKDVFFLAKSSILHMSLASLVMVSIDIMMWLQ